MKKRINLIACGVLCALASKASAQSGVEILDPVQVSADGLKPALTPVDAQQSSPNREAGDILREIAGVSGTRKGGHGTDPSIRGQSETRLNVLLDGAYVHGGCPARMDPPTSYATVNAYEEITVIKGVQTLEYGSGGSGGTILFDRVTERFAPDEPSRNLVAGSYRSNSDTWEISADTSFGGPGSFARFLGSKTEAGNYADGSGRTVRSSYDARSGTAILGVTPTPDERFEISFDRQETSDILFPGLGMDGIFANNSTVRAKYRHDGPIGLFSQFKSEFYVSAVDHLMNNYSLRPLTAPARLRVPSTSETVGGRLVGGLDSRWGDWKIGLDFQNNHRNANRFNVDANVLQAVMWPGVRIEQKGLFAELTHPLNASDRLILGGRFDRIDASAARANVVAAGGITPNLLYQRTYGATAQDQTENNLGGLIRYEHGFARGLLYAGLSRTVRTADATERYLARNSPNPTLTRIGNPNIKPETHHQAEIGLMLDGNQWTADGSLYFNKVDNFILRDRNALRNEIHRNIQATLIGGEFNLNYRWNAHWQSNASLAYVYAQNDTDHRAIAQTPPLEGSVSLDYHQSGWSAGGRIRGAAKQTRVDLDSSNGIAGDGLDQQATPAWLVLDWYANYAVNDAIDLGVGIDNVFDRTYAEHLNLEDGEGNTVQVNEPGRSIWLKLSAVF